MNTKLGFLYFTDAKNSGKGVAAVNGKPSKWINNTSELDTSTKWLTNLRETLPGNGKAIKHSFFLQNNYLRMSSDRILSLLRASYRKSEREQAEIMASIFFNVVSLGEHVFGIQNLAPYEYRKGIRQTFLPVDSFLPDDVYRMVLDSTQFYTFSTEPTNPDKRVVFHLPKVAHGKNILKTPLPKGTWLKIDSIPDHTEKISEWLSDRRKPFFAKVILSDFDPVLHPLINFGSIVPDGSDRQWVTNVELEMLIGTANIEIKEAWESSDILTSVSIIDDVLKLKELDDLSFSLGLLVENIWSGLALNLPPRQRTREQCLNVIGPFLRALDRKLCFEKALTLHQRGFTIASYGMGTVIVDASFHEDLEIISAALELELLPPYCPQLEIDPSKEDNFLYILQSYYATGDTDTILYFDREVVDHRLQEKQ